MTMAANDAPSIRVRMYRHGLGDCFLLSLLRDPPDRSFHMMIDCGVILGTPGAADRLRAVVTSIIEDTAGRVDVLVVTHEHYDHVAGFVLVRDLFAGADEAGVADRLSVGEVWFAWTEDPANELASAIRRERAAQLQALTAMALRLGAAAEDEPAVATALSFFGVDTKGKGLGATAQAMQNAAALAPPGRVRYLQPGTVIAPDAAPELRFRVLGPPMDRASLRRTDSTSEVYRIDADDLAASVRLAAGADEGMSDAASPFGPGWGLPLSSLADNMDDRADFFRDHYLDGPGRDEAWRRIDGAWIASAEGLALAMDGATNNTSLVLAIELTGSGKVLLFPADAQVGNWLSWEGLSWPDEGGAVTARDLLGRTVFYKVGHHGSHNATLRARGLELMPATDLVSFIPVDEAMAKKKRWNRMPLPALVDALRERCGDAVIRIDHEPSGSIAGLTTGGTGIQFGSLYFDWTLPL
jgi:hypothetical protein